ncbi:cupin domain-containing protein [Pseudohalocynthiibacter aestuariivivens]|uniref:XRE family transcriptional regulator n=1 Tax=Roseovarius pelagicus TaxID=2980108 RepID=A0ABY6DIJ0_9RHOB|nr:MULTISPECIES: XRE family transcriptional regulator [Rhodobacterales]QIE46689.1 cupin domain-containing protein [Pseudohalocynthiibacter aestuariivivens]UXX84778.1 XRE family transcriptional regulator [Roseovarius pelagicus]
MSHDLPKVLRPSNVTGCLDDAEERVNLRDVLDLDPRVGQEIRGLRKARDTTIAELGKATGLSKGYLSQIERGISSPSVKALHSISRALGVTISWFFPPETDDHEELRDIVVRAHARRTLSFESGITDELLSPNLDKTIELLRCTFPAGSESGTEPYNHRGEEAGIVISGQLDLWVDEKHLRLKEGDSFAFSSERPHRYANLTDRDTVVIWAISPPTY